MIAGNMPDILLQLIASSERDLFIEMSAGA